MSEIYYNRNDFLRFVQCKKTLYLKYHEKSDVIGNYYTTLTIPFTRARKFRNIGEDKLRHHAQTLFTDSPSETTVNRSLSVKNKIIETQRLLNEPEGLVFSGWFEHQNVAVFVDILQKLDGWRAYSIKPGGGSSFNHELDMALQCHILKKNGIGLESFSAIYVNKKYVYTGDFNHAQFFRIKDFLPGLGDSVKVVEHKMEEFQGSLSKSDISSIDIGNHCFQPTPCVFMEKCWSHIPAESVFEIATLDRSTKFQMYHQGIIRQKDINVQDFPELTEHQKMQIESAIDGRTTFRKPEMIEFLKQIEYPVRYLDFESFMPVIPMYPGTHPMQHIPFEYCIWTRNDREHMPKTAENLIENIGQNLKVYLADTTQDPRFDFMINFIRDIGDSGSILVFDSRLEIRHLRELMGLFPEFKEKLESIILRILDMTFPFQKKYYYTARMKGLYSIKNLLPALFPEKNYDDLVIQNGYMAMHGFESLFYETDPEAIARIRTNLKEYCKMDVMALLDIHRFLEKLVVE